MRYYDETPAALFFAVLALFMLFAELAGASQFDETGDWGIMEYGSNFLADDVSRCFGNTPADPDYCIQYDSTATQWEFWSTDTDGGGTDGNVIVIPDGTDYVRIGAGGAWKAGTSDDMICLQEVDDATDNVCLQANGDAFYMFQGNGSTYAQIVPGAVSAQGIVSSTSTVNADIGIYPTTASNAFISAPSADRIRLGDAASPTDDIVIDFTGDALTVYRGNGSTKADVAIGTLSTVYNPGVVIDNATGGQLLLDDSTPTGVNDALCGVIYFRSADSGSTNTHFAQIEGYTEEVTDTDEDGSLKLSVMDNGSMTEYLRLDATDGLSNPVRFPAGYTRHVQKTINAANVGATAPAAATIGNGRCLKFAQATAAETAHIAWSVPSDWDGASDMTVELHVFLDKDDTPSENEVVEYTVTYNAIDNSETYDKTSTTFQANYTLTSSDAKKDHVELTGTLDYDQADNPLAVGDDVLMSFDLHETNTTYGGDPILCIAHIEYTSVSLPED